MRTNSSPCPRALSSHPQRPPFPLCALSARFSCSLQSLRAHPLRQAPAAHPFCLGWRHTSSTPPSTQICAPSLPSPSSPAAALGADARPTTALSPGAAPPPGCAAAVKPPSVRAPSLAGERRGKCVRAAAPAFPARLLAGRLLACPSALAPGRVAGRRAAGSGSASAAPCPAAAVLALFPLFTTPRPGGVPALGVFAFGGL